MEQQEPTVINKQSMQLNREAFEKLMNSRSFYFLGSEIYGGVGGLYDWGPPGCAIKNNVQQIWREHFILEEDMLEISTTCITPEKVFHHSGHIKKFADLVVRDVVNKRPERADKYLDLWCTNLLENAQTPPLSEEQKKRLKYVQQNAEVFSGEELAQIYKELKIKSIDGNEFSDPEPFNLMFKVDIGPSGGQVGYLRPETAQGMFVNFNRLQNFNGGRVPFAAAQLGLGFRNEIAPRQQLIRVREFDMAEIEHFFDPENAQHPKFKYYANQDIPLLSSEMQVKEGAEYPKIYKLGETVEKGLIFNETLAYFMIRTYLFLVSVGVNKNNIRFRQHKPKEMAHYASDCWDAEIETSGGWIEVVGHANRSAYDLSCHQKGSEQQLMASRKLAEPKKIKYLELTLDNGAIGKEFQKKIQLASYFLKLSEQEKADLESELQGSKQKEVTIVQQVEKKDKEGKVIEVKEKTSKQVIDLEILDELKKQAQFITAEMQTKLKTHLENMTDEENRNLMKHFESQNVYTFQFENFYINFYKNMVKKVKECEKNVVEEKFIPNVIEPAFGMGRVIACILEHNFKIRPEDPSQKPEPTEGKSKKENKGDVKPIRSYLTLPPRVAPIKCSILPLMAKEVFTETIFKIKSALTRAGISNKVDDTGVAVGKRYARTDELGIPFGITVDYETIENGNMKDTVTLREIETMKQVRIPIDDLVPVISQLSNGQLAWTSVLEKYPLQESKDDQE